MAGLTPGLIIGFILCLRMLRFPLGALWIWGQLLLPEMTHSWGNSLLGGGRKTQIVQLDLRISRTSNSLIRNKHANVFNIFMHTWGFWKKCEDKNKRRGSRVYRVPFTVNKKLWGKDRLSCGR